MKTKLKTQLSELNTQRSTLSKIVKKAREDVEDMNQKGIKAAECVKTASDVFDQMQSELELRKKAISVNISNLQSVLHIMKDKTAILEQLDTEKRSLEALECKAEESKDSLEKLRKEYHGLLNRETEETTFLEEKQNELEKVIY